MLGYSAASNRVVDITRGATTVRSFTYDSAGNMLSDSRLGNVYAYTYNSANRLKTVSFQGNLVGTYTYNGGEQLIQRVITNSGSSNGTVQYVHDRMGNIIAEATSAGATAREYIWLPEAEIAPTFQSRAQVDRPVAVVDGVNTATPQTWYVAVDHLHRPIRMTNAAKAVMWSATWTPWGAPHAITGVAVLDARFPGQSFQLESSLHYNWHRHYDPTLGRYTLGMRADARGQPDPLGFVDGPSVYGYAVGVPVDYVDSDGRWVRIAVGGVLGGLGNFAYQLSRNGGSLKCVRWDDVVGLAGVGAGVGGIARGASRAAVRIERGKWGPRGKVWTNNGWNIPHIHFGTGPLTRHHLPWQARSWGHHFSDYIRRGRDVSAELGAMFDIGLGIAAISLGALAPTDVSPRCGCGD